MKHFQMSFIVTAVCLLGSAWWGYEHAGVAGALTAMGIAAILAVMEVSLSFDNAVVNASVLTRSGKSCSWAWASSSPCSVCACCSRS
jgi:hypothetical protein